jgi:subtilisin family serine protease
VKHRGPLAVVVALVATFAPAIAHSAAAATTTGRYIVQFIAGTDPDVEAARLSALGVEVADVYSNVFPGVTIRATADLIDQIKAAANIVRVEPDQQMSIDAADTTPPTVVQSAPSWGLDRIDQRTLPLSNSYSYNGAGRGVTAYIIDSGIRADHVDFGGRVRFGISTAPPTPGIDDCNGHGTHVAGTVGGNQWGVAKSVSLVAVRVLDCGGSTSSSQLIDGLDWVMADHQAGSPAVANLSISGAIAPAVDAAIQAVINDGIAVAVAAGNATGSPPVTVDACNRSPARVPQAITVAASTQSDSRASFSNFGPCVDLFAPGVGIPSDGISSTSAGATMSGTSMATPHVAGAAAVLLSEHPTWTPAQVTRDLLLKATNGVISDPMGSPNRLLFSAPIAPPVNDDFAAATPIDLTGPTTVTGSNVDATKEVGEPTHGPVPGGTSAWWSFVAPSFGDVTLSTGGSTFDTVLAVYTGGAVNALTALASNDGPGNGSAVNLRVEAGRTYHIAVDGRDGVVGTVALGFTWRPASFVPLVPAR